MKRILLMVLRNIIFVPYWYWRLWRCAKYSDRIPDDEKFAVLKKITLLANKGGNVEIQSTGTEHIPLDQSFIFFPNHQGMYDVLALISSSPVFFSVVMKKELENVFFINKVFKIMGARAIDRDDVRQSMKVIQQVSQDVKDGKSFVIFPEGTRSKNGNKVGDFKGGSFKSTVKAKCPIVPVAIIDSYKAFDTKSVKKVVVQVHYLAPVYYEEYKMLKTVEIAEIVRERIQKTIDNYTAV